MMRMPGPGGVVVMMGGRMTGMLGPGLPGGSGGCCLGAGAPLFCLARLGGTGGGGAGGAWGWKKGCVACWPGSLSGGSAGVCMVAFTWLRLRSASLRTVSGGLFGHGSAAGLVVERVVELVVPHGLGLHDPGLRGFRCVWAVGGPLSPVECCVEGFPRGAFAACEGGGLEESLPASWGVFRVYLRGVGLDRHEECMAFGLRVKRIIGLAKE